jgi:chemotaxis protein methyltransferase CheR
MVTYRPFNLLGDFGALGQFDLVFCRNVLIYFDQDTKISVLNRLARVVPADGYLVLGAAETVVGLTGAFKPMREHRGVYAVSAGKPVMSVVSPPLAPAPPATVKPLTTAKPFAGIKR